MRMQASAQPPISNQPDPAGAQARLILRSPLARISREKGDLRSKRGFFLLGKAGPVGLLEKRGRLHALQEYGYFALADAFCSQFPVNVVYSITAIQVRQHAAERRKGVLIAQLDAPKLIHASAQSPGRLGDGKNRQKTLQFWLLKHRNRAS